MKIISEKYKEIEEVKKKFMDTALLAGTILGFLAFIPTLVYAFKNYVFRYNLLSDFLVLAAFGIVYILRKKIKLEVKTLIVISGLMYFIVSDAVLYGIFSDNKILIVILLFITFLIFSRKYTIWLAGVISVGYIILAYFTITGYLKPYNEPNSRALSVDVWLINYLLFAIVIIALILLLKAYNNSFFQLIKNLENKNKYIKDKENRYTEIYNSVSDAIFISNLEGKIVDANESMLKMLKYRREELLSKHAKMLISDIPPYNYERFSEYIKQTMQKGSVVFEWYQKDKENNFFWLEITLKKTKIGGKERILVVANNIDKQKKAQLELEEYKNELEKKVKDRTEELESANEELISNNEELTILNENIDNQKIIIEEKEKRLRAIITNQGEGFGISDTDENFILATPRAHELFNVPEGKLVGRNLREFFDENEWAKIEKQTNLRKSNVRSSYETKITLKNGKQKYLIVTGTPDYDKDGNIVGTIANFRDITERITKEQKLKELNEEFETLNGELKEANEELTVQKSILQKTLDELENTQNQLLQSEKMASLGVLASGVAHEINNPLNYIMGGITGLEKMCKEQIHENRERVKPIMNAIKEGVRRTSAIVSELSHLSKNNDSDKENCNIQSVIDHCILLLNDTLKDKIDIRKKYQKSLIQIKCHVGKIYQVFLNILSNAVESIEKKGTIMITSKINTNFVIISIEDNGKGIKKTHLSKITDPFFTTKKPGKGTGLGLSIAHKIIEEHNGTVDFKSTVGKGTTVTVKLPININ